VQCRSVWLLLCIVQPTVQVCRADRRSVGQSVKCSSVGQTVADPAIGSATSTVTRGRAGHMGANRFLKLGGLELNSHGAQTFLSPPSSYPSPPNFRGLGY